MKREIQDTNFKSKNNPEIRDVCKDWAKSRMDAIKTAPFDDLARVLQEIDNRFNEVIDYLVYMESIKTKTKINNVFN